MKEDVLKTLFVGGERNYGLGKIRCVEKKATDRIFGSLGFNINRDIEIQTNVAIGHVKVDEVKMESGEIEPLVGLEWSEKGAGQKIGEALVCFTPGSKVSTGQLKLEHYGILGRS